MMVVNSKERKEYSEFSIVCQVPSALSFKESPKLLMTIIFGDSQAFEGVHRALLTAVGKKKEAVMASFYNTESNSGN
jgi:hypothetical protein